MFQEEYIFLGEKIFVSIEFKQHINQRFWFEEEEEEVEEAVEEEAWVRC